MKLIRGQLRLTQAISSCVATIGNFDGFHLGHQQLLSKLRENGRKLNLPTVVITFEPYPYEFFHRQLIIPRLMRFHEKWRLLEEYAIDYLVCLRFNAQLAQYSAEEFVQEILVKQLGIKILIIGDDFHFGAKRQGDVGLLQKLGKRYQFQTIQIPPFLIEGHRVSSTRIRQALSKNDFLLAKSLLGRWYFLCGKIVHGDGRGKQLGMATANINLSNKEVCVAGVYVVQVLGLSSHPLPGVACVGFRPMFSGRGRWLEVHLLNFDQDIYNRHVRVEFLHKLRDEQCFADTGALSAQMQLDKEEAELFFNCQLSL